MLLLTKLRSNSLRQRLGRGITLGLLLLFGLQYWGMDFAIHSLTRSYVLSRLEHDQESLLLALDLQAGGVLLLDQTRISPTFSRPFSGHYYLIQTASMTLASRSIWNHPWQQALLPTGQVEVERPSANVGPAGQALLILSQGFEKQGQMLTLSVAEDLSALDSQINTFRWIYALLSLLFWLLLLFLQHWLLQIGLRPLQTMQADLSSLEKGQRTELGLELPSELLPLAAAFNHLLNLLHLRLERSRDALGDLSHALKRPLTRIYQLLEKRPWPELAKEAQALENLIELELQRARLAGTGKPGQMLLLQEAVNDLEAVLAPIYAEKRLLIRQLIPPDLRVYLDRQDLLELLGNLLDNACKWAATEVVIEAQITEWGWWLEIRDDGPGCPEAELKNVSQRGLRADERVAGHGLGLAIARRIVNSYGGQIRFANLKPGFVARLEIPTQIEK